MTVISTAYAERPLHPSHYKSQLVTTVSRKSPARCSGGISAEARILDRVICPLGATTDIPGTVPCRVKARFSNLYNRLCHDILEEISHY